MGYKIGGELHETTRLTSTMSSAESSSSKSTEHTENFSVFSKRLSIKKIHTVEDTEVRQEKLTNAIENKIILCDLCGEILMRTL